MQSRVEIDTEEPEQISKAVGKSLESNEKIDYTVKSQEDSVKIKVGTEGLGQLRGCTDTIFRLTSLSKKILDR